MQNGSPNKTEERALLEFDYQGSTPCLQEVLNAMAPYWGDVWGNSSNRQNRSGLKAAAAVSLARDQLASCLGIASENLIFTSGATEANNIALLGHARARALESGRTGHLVTLATEHPSVLDPLRQLKKEGFRLTELSPGSDGLLSKSQLLDALKTDTCLVSLMFANNEIGVLQDIKELASICKERGVTFHTDAAQAFGNIPLSMRQHEVDFLSLSGHKLCGPKGIGVLALNSKKLPIIPLTWGGGQELGLRPGTIPVPLVVGLAKAAEIAINDLESRTTRLNNLRNSLWEGLSQAFPDLILNGSLKNRLAHNLNITIPGVRGSLLHRKLKPVISCSSGSACSNGRPSHVLLALGRSLAEAESSIRLSLGRNTTANDIENAITCISQVINDLRND